MSTIVTWFKCVDNYEDCVLDCYYMLSRVVENGLVLQDKGGRETRPLLFSEIVEHFDIGRVNTVELILRSVMYDERNIEIIGEVLSNHLPPAVRSKEDWDTVTANLGTLFNL